MEITLRAAKPKPAAEESESAESGSGTGKLRRLRRVARRRAVPALAVAALVGLPGTVAARQMVMGDDADRPSMSDEDWGASVLDPEDADFVEANWERAMDIEPIYDDGLDLEDEEMEPLAGALGANGIPAVAQDAYYNAEDTLAIDDPDCGVPWSLVAAIGRVESNHGRFGGAQLLEDGYGTTPIRGVPLDGRPGVALIRDTDNGALDDDPVYDRAVGPMQFIPSSWPGVASDGNTDGQKDPDNIYDASIGTGVYLCAGDGDLFEDEDARYAAVFRYNHSDEYVRTVLSLAEMYEEGGADVIPFDDSGFEDFGDSGSFDEGAAGPGELGPDLPGPTPAPAPAPAPRPTPQPTPRPAPSTTTSTTAPRTTTTTVPETTTTTAPDTTSTTVPDTTSTTVPDTTTTTTPTEVTQPDPPPADEVPTLPEPPTEPISVGWPRGMDELPPAELPPAPTPPTTAPAPAPATTECPAPADATATTTPTESVDPAAPDTTCEPSESEPAAEGAGTAGTDGASAEGQDAGSSPAPPDETSAP